ncbi:hypothetical protein EUX98_g9402 [Antrodiella citrinella]|uniref:HAT C-terminal dimerisation domain-containing protein n=1 Tax=Antrodiella citrinella TaxID=2447956 RepID=A0A4S4LUR5_9APHY|nr:hypothetical protein EUX98_g9402 [Antrodiella citrinella]
MSKHRRKRARRQSSPTSREAAASLSNEGSSTSAAPAPLSRKDAKILEFNERYDVENKSHEEVLAAQLENWSSDVYDHFIMPPGIITTKTRDGTITVQYVFVCKSHIGPSSTAPTLTRAHHDDSTSNLVRHVDICKPDDAVAPAGKAINDFAHGSTYSKALFRYLLSLWIACRHRPFSIIEDPELIRIFRMLYAQVEIPSASTISRDIQEIFTLSQAHIAKLLQDFPGRLHLGLDGWTLPNVLSFLGVTVHYIEGAQMRTFILDFVKLAENHTGNYLTQELAKCLKLYGIDKKILGITGDNASNNDTLMAELELLLGGYFSMLTHIRCLAHILNLIVKAILSLFIMRRVQASSESDTGEDDLELYELQEEDDLDSSLATREFNDDGEPVPQTDDDLEVDAAREEADAMIIEEIMAEVEASEGGHRANIRVAQFAITKLTQLAKRIFHSPAIREDLRMACELCQIKPKQMIRFVATRWNSVSQAISRALYLRPALDTLLALPKYDKNNKKSLRRFKPSPEEWIVLEQLEPVLEMFLVATELISHSSQPLLHVVIPIIDKLTAELENVIANNNLVQAVRLAATRGIKVLNKYYSATDESIMYRLAILLHPRYKMAYFKKQKWPQDWIDTATDLLRQQWVTYYKPKATELQVVAAAAAQASTSAPGLASSASASAHRINKLFAEDDFDNTGTTTTGPMDPLEQYLSTPPMSCGDPILYWSGMLGIPGQPENQFARMALDFLSAPATSTDVERAFSRGSLTVTKRRHALSDESVRAATVLSSWANIPDIIPEAHIVSVFKGKSRRPKGAGIVSDDVPAGVEVIEVD